MAPLKFEDNIKEKLEGRTIQPSQDAWEKLANQLDQNKHQKSNGYRYWWIGLAASIVGVVMIAISYQNSEVIDHENQLVETKEEINVTEKKEQLVEVHKIEKNEEKFVEKEDAKFDDEVNVEQQKLVQKTNKETRIVEAQKTTSNSLIEFPEKKNIIKKESHQILESPIINENVIDTKLADVLIKVQELEKANVSVTDDEIEALLYNAQKEILIEQMNSNTVSASALLQEVELELDETFKERVFEALKIGFDKLKTAVAEREN